MNLMTIKNYANSTKKNAFFLTGWSTKKKKKNRDRERISKSWIATRRIIQSLSETQEEKTKNHWKTENQKSWNKKRKKNDNWIDNFNVIAYFFFFFV